MKANLLLLLLCGMLPVMSAKIFYKIQESGPLSQIPLSMMDSSVDDLYLGCTMKMSEKAQTEYFPKKNDKFWKSAEKCSQRALKERDQADYALTKNHFQAICLYTAGGNNEFYKMFNRAVLTNAAVYTKSFPYHAVHFWLTSAIQILDNNSQTCHITYRRTNTAFTGKIHQVFRFGSFTSSSLKTDLFHFGQETCFYIKTCSGAYLKKYPSLRDHEQEVLIPPYEMFNITHVAKKSYKNLSDCKQIYVVESAGVQSNLNCKAAFAKKPFIAVN